MYPEDRVLVGVIKAKRDLVFARDARWYRIPLTQMPGGVEADYLAFFLSGGVFKDLSGSIPFYAQVRGLELAYRRDLIPDMTHARADQVYYRVALGELQSKAPPIRNLTRRPVSFIYTTWDRFTVAGTVAELYSIDSAFVDRAHYALHDRRAQPVRLKKTERK